MKNLTSINVQGHRGDRGNYPENSLPAFISALNKGVNTLELDVVVSKDEQVVISHEPYMSSVYMTKPNGIPVSDEEQSRYNLYRMEYQEIQQFDGGSRGNIHFPNQHKLKTYKPLLKELFVTIQALIHNHNLQQVNYNIEIKSEKQAYGISQPYPKEFIDLVMQEVNSQELDHVVTIQSFDIHILELTRKKYPHIPLAYLVEEGVFEKNIKLLNFKPEIYSPLYTLLDVEEVQKLKKCGLQVIPWTVNTPEAIQDMIALGVDGIISDYPERVMELLAP